MLIASGAAQVLFGWVRSAVSASEGSIETLGGIRISYANSAYILDQEASGSEQYPHGLGERYYFRAANMQSVAEVSAFDDEDSAEATLRYLLAEFAILIPEVETLIVGESDGCWYALSAYPTPIGVSAWYVEIQPDVVEKVDVLQGFMAPLDRFEHELTVVRNEVLINGVPFLQKPFLSDIGTMIANYTPPETQAATPDGTLGKEYSFEGYESHVIVSGEWQIPGGRRDQSTESVTIHGIDADVMIAYLNDERVTGEQLADAIAESSAYRGYTIERISLTTGSDRTTAIYQFRSRLETDYCYIQVQELEQDVWHVQAIRAKDGVFEDRFQESQDQIAINGEPVFRGTSIADVMDAIEAYQDSEE